MCLHIYVSVSVTPWDTETEEEHILAWGPWGPTAASQTSPGHCGGTCLLRHPLGDKGAGY